jgi:UDP-N-acetylglucosamine 2-epimerase (non-hydrolysing)
MIDTLLRRLPGARKRDVPRRYGLAEKSYGFVTLHRPSNVDSRESLAGIVEVLIEVAGEMPVVFPVHPRTSAKLKEFELLERLEAARGVTLLEPLGYLDCLSLTSKARVIVTDSGGLQEESTALEVPCLTMRENTERPITVSEGTSTLVGNDAAKLHACLNQVLNGTYRAGRCPELWDGKASERIAAILAG